MRDSEEELSASCSLQTVRILRTSSFLLVVATICVFLPLPGSPCLPTPALHAQDGYYAQDGYSSLSRSGTQSNRYSGLTDRQPGHQSTFPHAGRMPNGQILSAMPTMANRLVSGNGRFPVQEIGSQTVAGRRGSPIRLVGAQDNKESSPIASPPAIADGHPNAVAVPDSAESSVRFNFQNAPWELVLTRFADENQLALQADSMPTGTFSYLDSKPYSIRESLDILNDFLIGKGYLAVLSGRKIILLRKGRVIGGNLVRLVTREQIPMLGRNELASVSIPAMGTISDSVTKELEPLLGPFGSAMILPNSRQIVITDTGAYLVRLSKLLAGVSATSDVPSRVFQLKNASAEDVAKAINEFFSLGSPESSEPGSSRRSDSDRNSNLVIVAEQTTNSILARGTDGQLRQIDDLVRQLDIAPQQVVIQALLVEVELGNVDEFGVEVGIQDSVLFNRSVVDNLVTLTETTTNLNGSQTTSQSVISQTAQPGFNFNNQPLGNNTSVNPGRLGGQALSSLALGRVNGDLQFGGLVLSAGSESVNVLLRALAATHKLEILSRPQVRTLHNKEALIQIGQQVPVVDGVSVTAVGSANPVIRQDQAGIILKVTPKISPEGQVMIDVNAEKSAFRLSPGTGVPIFTDATNGNVIEAPVKDLTTAATSVSAQSGQTIVLGGMITNEMTNVSRRVPFLGDLPLLGTLFRYEQDQLRRKELLIFLTPRIIQSDEADESMKQIEVERTQFPQMTAEQMHGPIFGQPSLENQRLGGHSVGIRRGRSSSLVSPQGSIRQVSGENAYRRSNRRRGHSSPYRGWERD